MKSLIVLAFFALIQTCYAQFFITQPVTGVQWKNGDTPLIDWQPSTEGDANFVPKSLVIDLMYGNSNAAVFVTNIAYNWPGDKNSFQQWTVPDNLVTGNEYFLRITTTSDAGKKKISYSSTFNVSSNGSGSPANKGKANGGVNGGASSDATRVTAYGLALVSAFVSALLFF